MNNSHQNRNTPHFWKGALLVGMTLLVYFPSFFGDFLWDDDDYIVHNEVLRAEDGLKKIWLEPGSVDQYYPLTFTSFFLEHKLWGLNPFGYHVVNVLLHIANALLFFILLRRLNLKGAWLAAFLFALHPVHVESVAWISERKNTLSTFFFLMSLLCFARGSDGFADSFANQPWQKRYWLWLSFLSYLLALWSKTVTSCLPVVILLLIYEKRRWRREDFFVLIPFFLAGLGAGLTTTLIEKHVVGLKWINLDLSIWDRLVIAGRVPWFYAAKLVWPASLNFNYPRWHLDPFAPWQLLFPILSAALIIGLFARRKKIGKAPFIGVSCFFVGLAPASGLFDVYPMRFSFVADHFQYLASFAFLALVAHTIETGMNRLNTRIRLPHYVKTLPVIVVLGFGALTLSRCFVFLTPASLWQDTLRKNPESWLANNNYGVLLLKQQQPQESLSYFRRAVEMNPTHAQSNIGLGMALLQLGQEEQGTAYLREGLKHGPHFAPMIQESAFAKVLRPKPNTGGQHGRDHLGSQRKTGF